MRKKTKVALILLLCAALVGAAAIFVSSRCLWIGGKLCALDARKLDLSGRNLEDIEKLSSLTQPQQLDLRGTGLTPEEYAAIRLVHPRCRILWDVPLQGQYLPWDSTSVSLTYPTSEDLDILACFPALDTICVTACSDPAAIQALQQRYPHCQLQYQLTVEGVPMDQATTQTALRDAQNIAAVLDCMPQLAQINALSCQDTAALQALQQKHPNCRLIYNIPVGEKKFPTNAGQLSLQAVSPGDLAQILPYFYQLNAVTIAQPVADPEPFRQLEQHYPDIAFTYSFSLLGVTVSNRDTSIDLSGIVMENTDAVEAALPYFHNLEKVDMLTETAAGDRALFLLP